MLILSPNHVQLPANLVSSQMLQLRFVKNAHLHVFRVKPLFYVHHVCQVFIAIMDNVLIVALVFQSDIMVMMLVILALQAVYHHTLDLLVQANVK
jgi:hypothetical protein